MFFEKAFPKYFVKFTGKHLCWSLKPVALLKRYSNTGVCLVNFVTFLPTVPASSMVTDFLTKINPFNQIADTAI